MANEITLGFNGRAKKGTVDFELAPTTSLRYDQTNEGGGALWLDIGTTKETVSFGDGTPGLVIIRNHDATNFIKFGDNSATALVGRVGPGKVAIFELAAGATLALQADTAACKVEVRWANA